MKQPRTKIDNNYDYLEGIKYASNHKNGRKNRNCRKGDMIMSRQRRRILDNMIRKELLEHKDID